MSPISKPDHCAERANLALLSAYQEYLMTFKLMTSQVVQRARPFITHICVVGIQRVKGAVKTPVVDLLRLNVLRDHKTAFLTPKRYDK